MDQTGTPLDTSRQTVTQRLRALRSRTHLRSALALTLITLLWIGVYLRTEGAPSQETAALAAAVANRPAAPAGASPPAEEKPLKILSVTPTGEDVPAAEQIVLQFDRPVVPLGRMEREASELPITIEPALPCHWRWLNNSALACQLTEDGALAPATRYRLVVQPGIEAGDGSTLAEDFEHHFVTTRPGVVRARFKTWLGPTTPELFVTLSQPATPKSLAEHLFFIAPGNQRIALRVAPRDPNVDPNQELTWIVTPVRELPPDAELRLLVEPGLVSLRGPERGVESKTVVAFETFPEHRFLGVRCHDNSGDKVFIQPGSTPPSGERRTGSAKTTVWTTGCNPMRGVRLVFSSPVLRDLLGKHLQVIPDLAGGRTDYDPWGNSYSYSRLNYSRRSEYSVALPELLKADTEYHLQAAAGDLLDEFGRPLAADVDLRFHTNDRPPHLVLTHPVSVLERGVPTHVPAVVTNLDRLVVKGRTLTPEGRSGSEWVLPLPEVKNVAYSIPLKVRDWLQGRSGAIFAHLRAAGLPHRSPWIFSQVTPFQVHAKLGHRSSAVWVTDLATGQPVAGARVRVYADHVAELIAEPKVLAAATTDASGVAMLPGNDRLDPRLELAGRLRSSRSEPVLFLRVDKVPPEGDKRNIVPEGGKRNNSEMALLPLAYQFSVRPESASNTRIRSWSRPVHGHVRTWGTTAQGIYRIGDTVQYKLYVRDQNDQRFIAAKAKGYTLRVKDPLNKVVHEVKDFKLNAFGANHGEFKIAESGAVGWYVFELTAGYRDQPWHPMRVLVADFTPAPFRVTTELHGELFHPGDELQVATRGQLHSGGPYAEAGTRTTATLRATAFRSDHPRAKGFRFDVGSPRAKTVHQSTGVLDAEGAAGTTFVLPWSEILHGQLRVESAVRDDRGKYVSGVATARYVARDLFVGIRQGDWIFQEGKPAEVHALVVDEHGQPVAGIEIATRIEYRETKASRVKGAGNAYLTQYVHTWQEAATCTSVSRDEAVTCELTPTRAGRYRLTHTIKDRQGRPHQSTLYRWATGRGRALWEVPAGHHLPIEPEKTEYQIGDTARFLIRNPFPGAQALLTIERIGVQRQWTRVLESSTEVVEFEVTPDHLPGFYFSGVVTSPRLADPLPDADTEAGGRQIDLGKPAFRMGYVRVPVRDPYKEIVVEVQPRQDTYKPRETVTVELKARPRHHAVGEPLPAMELAVAVLDEAVFDLLAAGRETFDPYQGFYRLDPLDLKNFNLLTRLVGIQSFEKKGANAGGGGAAGPDLRSLFKFVSYWNPAIETDAEGRATIEFQVPDNLTGWRVLALAMTPEDLMGLGEGTFKVNQPIELRPALPNQVIEGDKFTARFTVMNRTESRQTLTINAGVTGAAESPGLDRIRLEAEPYKRYPLSFPVKSVPPEAGKGNTGDGEIQLTIRAESATDRDALRRTLPVGKRMALEAAATYGTTTDPQVTEAVAFPDDMRTDVGRLSVVASPSVIGGVEGAFEYLRDYPYGCWEQILTQGVMASHFAELEPYVADGFTWPEHQAIPQRTLDAAANFQAPNGGMVYWRAEDRYVSPYLSAYTALAFHWLSERDYRVPVAVEQALDAYLLRLLRGDAFPDFYSRGMASSVRAVALAALAGRGKVDGSDLDRYRRHVPEMDLFGKAHYLMAAVATGAGEELRAEVTNTILAHANQTGGKFTFTEPIDVAFQRIHHSSPRSQCAILSALVQQQGTAPTGSAVGDVPFKLTRSITQERERRDRWENTQENMFCMNALIDFRNVYERESPRLTVRAFLDGEKLGKARFDDVRDPPAELERPLIPSDPGRQATLKITRSGSGRLYYAARLFYSPAELKTEPIHSGMTVKREYSVERDGKWILLADPMRIERGELVRVDLFLRLPAARNFVVVDDPVPGGLEPVNRDLKTASEVDAKKGDFQFSDSSYWYQCSDWRGFGGSYWSFYHRELRHHAARFFSDYLPAGNYHLSYVAQAIAPGEFQVLPAHAEEMYDPDVFGQGVPGRLVIEDSPTEGADR